MRHMGRGGYLLFSPLPDIVEKPNAFHDGTRMIAVIVDIARDRKSKIQKREQQLYMLQSLAEDAAEQIPRVLLTS